VRAVLFFTSGLFSELGNVRRAFSKILSVFLLFVDIEGQKRELNRLELRIIVFFGLAER
jgi:hypothetical protein